MLLSEFANCGWRKNRLPPQLSGAAVQGSLRSAGFGYFQIVSIGVAVAALPR